MAPFKVLLVILPLLTNAGMLQAEVLYKWKETDGTLTFSPTPPPAASGIVYEKVGSLKSVTAQPAVATAAPTPNLAPVIGPASSVQPPQGITPAQPVHMASVAPSPKKMTSRKSEQCNELVKRVTSLERLLSTKIDAETMDNAVVQMAKYQNSYNRACRGIGTSIQ